MELEEFGANDLKGMSTGQIIEFLSQLLLKVKSVENSCSISYLPSYSMGVPEGEGPALECGKGMCRIHDPLFSGQSVLPSLPMYHQSPIHVPSIFNFQKI